MNPNIEKETVVKRPQWQDHDSSLNKPKEQTNPVFGEMLQQVADEFNKFVQTNDKPTNLQDFINKYGDKSVLERIHEAQAQAEQQAIRNDIAKRISKGPGVLVSPPRRPLAEDQPKQIRKDSLSEVIKTQKDADDFMRQVKSIGTTKAEELAQQAAQKAAQLGGSDPARGLRYNSGKTLYNLIPPYPLEQIAKVFTKGAEKYAPNNWKKGMPWSEVEGSLMRHFEAYRSGEDFDEESKLYHMAHVAVNAIFILDYYRSNPKFDDRYKSYMQKPRIVLDIDEVLCGWAAGYKTWTGKDIQATYWDSRYGFTSELAELAKNKEFWLSLPCIRKPDFVPHAYVSSRSIPVEWTQEWLEKNGLPCRPVHHVPFDHSKIEILKSLNVDYFVDDRFENFFEAEQAGICTFLMDASHNGHYHVGFKRIHDLKLKNIVR